MPQPLLVAAAAIINEQGQVLIARRPVNADQGGLWEFPGGKLAPYETGLQALKREIHEELGIEIQKARPLIRVRHEYPGKTVLLDVWKVLDFSGEPWGREGQPVRWVDMQDLGDYSFPAANRPILNAIRLPDQYMVTGDFASPEMALQRLHQALEQGIRLVQLRAPQLDAEAYRLVAQQFLEACRKANAQLLLNADPALLEQVDADGVHLNSARLAAFHHRPVSSNKWLSVACHDLASLKKAETLQADLATLSPIQVTSCHPDVAPLGWQAFQELIKQVRMPVYALGGMSPTDRDRVFGLGGQGVAGISCYWSS
ncbi:Nudix family hydrolase [Marinospirillum alkaliphilum]|uniref:8-oxo-dGTP diphosphatase n=1 Tax=Marinospirillum alkaliphilum DSM 21637 TaxID=1122209 RepID=A0A1K1TTX8_9GAMM|nr:Nudix family hydrolase [Marinospirillum alkaliphilum]SFX03507.1 8-oxo-dGTP diphosphatase [Marinospirillum alkaliphilum DSM 21637]